MNLESLCLSKVKSFESASTMSKFVSTLCLSLAGYYPIALKRQRLYIEIYDLGCLFDVFTGCHYKAHDRY